MLGTLRWGKRLVRDIAGRTIREGPNEAAEEATRRRSVSTAKDRLASGIAGPRFLTLLLLAFAGIALLLTVVGLYGVLTYSVLMRTREIGLRVALGAGRSEVMQANADGYFFLKFFPAMQAGGIAMLKALGGPFTDVVFCPTGGISLATAPDFLALPNVKVCGGSWLTPADAVAAKDWARITALAKEASALKR